MRFLRKKTVTDPYVLTHADFRPARRITMEARRRQELPVR
jgi:hypothetical protein